MDMFSWSHQDGGDDVRLVLQAVELLQHRPVHSGVHVASTLVPVADLSTQVQIDKVRSSGTIIPEGKRTWSHYYTLWSPTDSTAPPTVQPLNWFHLQVQDLVGV